jgi:hypothetical protein
VPVTDIAAVSLPSPVRVTFCGLFAELFWIVRVPVRVPAAVGSKITWMAQVTPIPELVPQLLDSLKSPEAEIAFRARTVVPVFETVTDCAALLVETFWMPNVRLEVERLTEGVPVVVPLPFPIEVAPELPPEVPPLPDDVAVLWVLPPPHPKIPSRNEHARINSEVRINFPKLHFIPSQIAYQRDFGGSVWESNPYHPHRISLNPLLRSTLLGANWGHNLSHPINGVPLTLANDV